MFINDKEKDLTEVGFLKENFYPESILNPNFSEKTEDQEIQLINPFISCRLFHFFIPILLIVDTSLNIYCPLHEEIDEDKKSKLFKKQDFKYFLCTHYVNKNDFFNCPFDGHGKFEYYCPKCDKQLCVVCMNQKICIHKEEIIIFAKERNKIETMNLTEQLKLIPDYKLRNKEVIEIYYNNYLENPNHISYFKSFYFSKFNYLLYFI